MTSDFKLGNNLIVNVGVNNPDSITIKDYFTNVNRQIEQMNQVMKQGIKAMLANGMNLELISKSLSKSEDEIMELLK